MFDVSRLDDGDGPISGVGAESLRALATAGAQVRRMSTAAAEAGVLALTQENRPRDVLVAAMGADHFVTDVASTVADRTSAVAVVGASNVPLPGWVGALDLVIAVSLSGRARGPLQLAAEAGRRGAQLLSVGAPDSPLAEVTARARGIHVAVDGDGLSSRTAAWSLLTPVVLALGQLGVLQLSPEVLPALADRLDAQAQVCRPSSESFVNPAKVLALDVAGRIPMILGDGPLTAVVARRFGSMLTRTARVPAMTGELPDAASALLACLDGPFVASGIEGGRDIFADPFDAAPPTELALVAIRDPIGDPGELLDVARHNLTQGLLDLASESGALVREVSAAPGPDLVRIAELVARTDFAATYLALGYGHNPRHSAHVTRLRDLLG